MRSMSSVGMIFHLMRADLRERVRSYSFLIVMGLSVLAGYLLVPPFGAPYTSFVIGSHRGIYNSPWVGTMFGLVACTWLALFGFYLVKNTVERDGRTRVGLIIASTPVHKPFYTLGKWLSNLAVLALILAALTVIAPIMQYVRAEELHIDLKALATPIWLMGFPALALVSALAVLFECIPFLRGGLGNVVYFFIWGPLLVGSIGSTFAYGPNSMPHNDFAGVSRSLIDIQATLAAGGYDASHGVTGVVAPVMGFEVTRFRWDGVPWTANVWLERATWLCRALLVALAAAIPFDRFDPARHRLARWQRQQRRRVPERLPAQTGQDQVFLQAIDREDRGWVQAQFEPLSPSFGLRSFTGVVTAELRLMFKGLPWVWYLVAAGLIVACLFSPLHLVRTWLLPLAWLWPLLVWSQMGNREHRHGVWQMVFSAPRPTQHQLPAMWLAGVLVAAIAGSGAAIKFAAMGTWMSLFAWAAGAAFIPALALMLGVWTNTSRMFEMVYLLWWYLALNGLAAADFIGTTQGAAARGNPWLFLALAPVLFLLALVGRQRYDP
jgi:hypothetical protein